MVLDEGPHHGGRPLGAQRESATAAILELVHLLADDVGALTDPVEHLRVLEDRRQHQAVAEAPGPVGEPGDQLLPAVGFGCEHVAGPVGRAELASRCSGLGHVGMLPAASGRSRAIPQAQEGLGAGRFSSPARIPGRSVNFGALLPMNRGQQR